MLRAQKTSSNCEQKGLITAQRPTVSHGLSVQPIIFSLVTSSDKEQRPRTRKPSPGLAARVQALKLGLESTRQDSHNDQVGRIPEDQISKIDNVHRANSNTPAISRERYLSNNFRYSQTETTNGIFTEPACVNLTILQQDQTRISRTMAAMANSNQAEVNVHACNSSEYSSSNFSNEHIHNKEYKHIKNETCGSLDQHSSILKEIYSDGVKPSHTSPETPSYFNPYGLQRTGSIYTISRDSFTSKLAKLTSLQLPDAESLSTMTSNITSARAAFMALDKATEQIRGWISKASDVIDGLVGEDDIEWAAAGGREGLAEIDNSICPFEKLINIYVSEFSSLQARSDISSIPKDEIKRLISDVESVILGWVGVKKILKKVKNSVEIAMEWEELWDTVLGDIGMEMNVLKKLVFEMEEKRHKSVMKVKGDGMGLAELGTIIEESSPLKTGYKFSTSTDSVLSPTIQTPLNEPAVAYDDTKLLALFARMQPLRASLDFFPMRLSTFVSRAKDVFPNACDELKSRLLDLEASWVSLEKDAESLRKELGEDRWVLVFKVAARQAQKMYESVERSVVKLTEAVESGSYFDNSASFSKRYEKKKKHYGPAIERVLSIIDKGVEDRLTVNGEILLLRLEMQRKWEALKARMNQLDKMLMSSEKKEKNNHPRDSVSSAILNGHSTLSSFHVTPGSSPTSSIFTASQGGNHDLASCGLPQSQTKSRLPQLGGKRISSLPTGIPHQNRQVSLNHFSSLSSPSSHSSFKQESVTPTANRLSKPSITSNSDGKPRWNSSTKVQEGSIGLNFKPFIYSTPVQSASKTPTTNSSRKSTDSKTNINSPRLKGDELLTTDTIHPRTAHSRLSLRDRLTGRISSPGRSVQHIANVSQPRLHAQSLSTLNANSSFPIQSQAGSPNDCTPSRNNRPLSSLASTRRMSSLPLPKQKNLSIRGSNLLQNSIGNETSQTLRRKPFQA